MASPGMLQQGLSRELFELWCSDRRNGLVMPGYSVVGTLANHLLSEPKEIQTSGGDWVAVNLTITYVSFSARAPSPGRHFLFVRPEDVFLRFVGALRLHADV